jgi:hypothetical protein
MSALHLAVAGFEGVLCESVQSCSGWMTDRLALFLTWQKFWDAIGTLLRQSRGQPMSPGPATDALRWVITPDFRGSKDVTSMLGGSVRSSGCHVFLLRVWLVNGWILTVSNGALRHRSSLGVAKRVASALVRCLGQAKDDDSPRDNAGTGTRPSRRSNPECPACAKQPTLTTPHQYTCLLPFFIDPSP